MTGCGAAKNIATDAALGAIGLGGSDGGIDATAVIGREVANNTALNTTLRPVVRGEGNTGTISQETTNRKVDNSGEGKVTINELDPKIFAGIIALFLLWSYFLYRLPSPEQIWGKKTFLSKNTAD